MSRVNVPLLFNGGLDTESGSFALAQGDYSEILNFLPKGRFISKRGGSKAYNSQPLFGTAGKMVGGFRAYSTDGATKKTILAANLAVYSGVDSTGIFTSKATVTAQPTYAFFEHFVNTAGASIVVICLPDDNTFSNVVQKYTIGADTAGALGGTPAKAWFPIEFQRYLFLFNAMVGTTHYPNRGYFSSRDNGEVHDTTNDFIRVPYGTGAISGVKKLGDVMYVFTERAIYAVTGTTFSATAGIGNQRVSDAVVKRGCIAPNSLASTGDMVIFLSEDGVRAMDGSGNVQILSGKIRSTIDRITKASPFCKAAGHYDLVNNRYLLSFNDSVYSPDSSSNWEVLACDLTTTQWYPLRYKYPIRCFFDWPSFGDDQRTYNVDHLDGFIHKANCEIDYDDAPQKKIATFEADESWAEGGGHSTGSIAADTTNVKEGARGIAITSVGTDGESMVLNIEAGFSLTRFNDNTISGDDDYIQFKLYIADKTHFTYMELDFSGGEMGLVAGGESGFGYKILASAVSNGWNTIRIKKRDFWGAVDYPPGFLNYIYFWLVSDSSGCVVTVDDLRLVGHRKAGIKAEVTQARLGADDPMLIKTFLNNKLIVDNFEDSEINHESSVDGKTAQSRTVSAKEEHIYLAEGTILRKAYKTNPEFTVATLASGLTSIKGLCADDDYLYVWDAVSAASIVIRKIAKSNMTQVASLDIGAEANGTELPRTAYSFLRNISVDDKYIYTINAQISPFLIIDKSTMTLIRSVTLSLPFDAGDGTSTKGSFCVDGLFVYMSYMETANGDTVINKLLKADLLNGIETVLCSTTLEMSGASRNENSTYSFLHVMLVDKSYLYAIQWNSESTSFVIKKFKKKNLELVQFSSNIFANIGSVYVGGACIDDKNLYVIGTSTSGAMAIFSKETLELIDSVAATELGAISHGMTINSNAYYNENPRFIVCPINAAGNWCEISIWNNKPGQPLNLYSSNIAAEGSETST